MGERCKAEVWPAGTYHPVPCSRSAVAEGWCKQHHPDEVQRRRDESSKAWHAKLADERRQRVATGLREATPADIVAYVAALPEAEAVALLMAVPQVRALVEAAQQASPSIEEIGAYSAALKPFKVPHE